MVEARRRAEAAEVLVRRVFETSQDLILVTDRNGTSSASTERDSLVLGYDPPKEMVCRSGVDFVHPDDLEARATRCAVHAAAG